MSEGKGDVCNAFSKAFILSSHISSVRSCLLRVYCFYLGGDLAFIGLGRLCPGTSVVPVVPTATPESRVESADGGRRRLDPEMVKFKVGISFKRLRVIFFHSCVRSIAPKITF